MSGAEGATSHASGGGDGEEGGRHSGVHFVEGTAEEGSNSRPLSPMAKGDSLRRGQSWRSSDRGSSRSLTSPGGGRPGGLSRQMTLAHNLEAAVAQQLSKQGESPLVAAFAAAAGNGSSNGRRNSSMSLGGGGSSLGGVTAGASLFDPVGEDDAKPPYSGPLPKGMAAEEWTSKLFKKALDELGMLEEELLFPERCEEQLQKVTELFNNGRIDQAEYDAKCKGLCGATSSGMQEALGKMRSNRDDMISRVRIEVEDMQREKDRSNPCPRAIPPEKFRSPFFQQAATGMGCTLEELSKPAKSRLDLDRIQGLYKDGRIPEDDYRKKIRVLLSCDPDDAEDVLGGLLRQNDELVLSVARKAHELQIAHEKEVKHQLNERKRKQEMIMEMAMQIDKVMAAEEKSNRLATSRRRYQLEQVLIQKGVAVKLQQLEEVEENTTQMARVLKKAPTWQHVPLVTKNRAALERKNMVLRRRAHQPEPTPMHAVVRPKLERTPSGGLLTKQRLLQDETLRRAKRVQMIEEEKRKATAENTRKKLIKAEQVKAAMDAERKKQLELQRLKKPDRETVAKRIESMKRSKMMELQRKMLGNEERLMMLNAFKAEQRKHLDELHKQSKLQDDAVKEFMKLAKSGMPVSASTASNLGIDVDKSRIEQAIAELTRQLTQPPDTIVIPKTDKTGMFVAPDAFEELYTVKVQRSRPASAPPVSAHSPGKISAGRPSTATRAQGVDSLTGSKREFFKQAEDPAGMVARLRREQTATLLAIVTQERAREEERREMLEAVLPMRRETLEALFEKEREKAGQEIMRVAAENEMILMSEMAKAGGKR